MVRRAASLLGIVIALVVCAHLASADPIPEVGSTPASDTVVQTSSASLDGMGQLGVIDISGPSVFERALLNGRARPGRETTGATMTLLAAAIVVGLTSTVRHDWWRTRRLDRAVPARHLLSAQRALLLRGPPSQLIASR